MLFYQNNDKKVVHPLGFEPKTLALEGRCSIQLSYGRVIEPFDYLTEDGDHLQFDKNMVGVEGFEPPTTCTQNRCATKLRYTP